MNDLAKTEGVSRLLTKLDPASPALRLDGPKDVLIKAGTVFAGVPFEADTPVRMAELVPGTDYVVKLEDRVPVAMKAADLGDLVLGGFHFAPGGNATARTGGDTVAAINPFSLWDQGFRPACADPCGMVLVTAPGRQFWCDIYLTGVEHMTMGTSAFDAVIADGYDRPIDPATGKPFRRFDYAAACAVMKRYGKGLLSFEEFAVAAYGVTEKTAAERDPRTTGLDAARTSRFGLMQATGNMWVWGHDGDPDEPRASLLGGSWLSGGLAGSRYADLDGWAVNSYEGVGARGRSDHLQLA
jgi:hypothetical protein